MITVYYINFLLLFIVMVNAPEMYQKIFGCVGCIVSLIGFILEVLNETHKDSSI